MGSPLMAPMVWLLTLCVLAGGGYALFQYVTEYQDMKSTLADGEKIKELQPKDLPETENWISMETSGRSPRGLGTNVLSRVTPGDPYALPKPKEEPKPEGKEVPKPEVKLKTLEEQTDVAREAFITKFGLAATFPGAPDLAWAEFCPGPHDPAKYLTQGAPATRFKVNQGLNIRDVIEANGVRGVSAADADAILLDVQGSAVRIAYKPVNLAALLAELKPEDRPENNRFVFEVNDGIAIREDASLQDIAEGTEAMVERAGPGKIGGPRTSVPGGTKTDPQIEEAIEKMGPAPEREPPKTYAKEDMKSRKIDDNTYFIGGEDLTREAMDESAQYLSQSVDQQGNPDGLKVAPNLPKDSRIARSGFQAGDKVVSINGKAVNNVGEIRKLVDEQKKAGVTRFDVIYVRNGLEKSRTFNTAQKK